MRVLLNKIILILFLFFFKITHANNIGVETGLEIPRYISLKSDETNIRVGPSKNYPIVIKYIVEDYPLKIIEEHRDWRRIIDFDGNTGWVHKSLIKGQRSIIIISENKKNIYLHNISNGKIIGEVNNKSFLNLYKCKKNWCLVGKNKHKGWVKKKYLWGIQDNEIFNISFFQNIFDFYFKTLNFFENALDKNK